MNESGPLITILMPCKNPEPDFLREALDSVYGQSSSRWNLLIVVDDDEDRETILHTLADMDRADDRRASVVLNESRLLTGALNTGMTRATTPFACSLLCDDLFDVTAIETLTRNIEEHSHVDYFHSSRRYVDEAGNPLSQVYQAREAFELNDFKRGSPVKHLNCWRIEAALSIGGMDENLGLHGADDYDFPWCMAETGFTFRAVPECLYIYRDHRSHYRLTTHVPLENQIDELKKIWRKHALTDLEIEALIAEKTDGYLKQALFLDEADKDRKADTDFDIRQGWREEYS